MRTAGAPGPGPSDRGAVHCGTAAASDLRRLACARPQQHPSGTCI